MTATPRPSPGRGPALEVEDLRVALPLPGGEVSAVRGVSFQVAPGEVLALAGESGSGKTTVLLALLGLLPPGARCSGRATCGGEPLLPAREADLRRLRGGRIAAVFQDPAAALDPTMPVGAQVAEGARLHLRLDRRAAAARAADLLAQAGLGRDPALLRRYPHQISGGMRQRVAVAMALAADPAVLLADEPTAGLDPIRATGLLALLRGACAARGMGLVLVTHDLRAAGRAADRLHVLYAGRIVERGRTTDVLARPAHPYTRGLVGALPRLAGPAPAALLPEPLPGGPARLAALPQGCPFAPRCPHAMRGCLREDPREYPAAGGRAAACWLFDPEAGEAAGPLPVARPGGPPAPGAGSAQRAPGEPVLEALSIRRDYAAGGAAPIPAVDGATVRLFPGRTLALVGESGCGKSSLARVLAGLERPDAGTVFLDGEALLGLPPARRRRVQILLQEASLSLDPRMRLDAAVTEGLLDLPRAARYAEAARLLGAVGLAPEDGLRYPHELSGGQRERAALARALAVEPAVLVADEPFTGLDASSQAQVARLLHGLCRSRRLALLVMGHDLALLAAFADEIAVMFGGRIVEHGPAAEVVARPRHPYTQALLAAAAGPAPNGPERPGLDRRPDGRLGRTKPGCPYAPRCPVAMDRCAAESPSLAPAPPGHQVACLRAEGGSEAPG